MTNFEVARANMIEGQVRTNDVTDTRLQGAMKDVPREHFLPKAKRDLAYMGKNIEIAPGRYLMGPRSFAKLVQALHVEADDLVLVIGSGSGYGAAVLGQMADSVVAVEADEGFVTRSSAVLTDLGIDNVAVVHGDPAKGLEGQGPYDVIFFEGSVSTDVEAVATQLKEGGRLGVVVQNGPMGRASVLSKVDGRITSREVFDANVEPLPGFQSEMAFEL